MKKILITGSAGYIGQHLTKLLRSFNYQVHGLDCVPDSQMYTVDVTRHDWQIVRPHYDAVVHLAALVNVGESTQKPLAYYKTNIVGTMRALANISYDHFIFASTGAAENLANPYGISKRAAEDIVKEWCATNKKPYTVFRFYNVIGSDGFLPKNPDGLFINLVNAAKTGTFRLYGTDYSTPDGTCVRDFVHVNEICYAIKTAIEQPANGIECLGHGEGNSILEMIKIFKEVNCVDFEVVPCNRRDGDIERSVLNTVSRYMTTLYSIEELLLVK